MPPPASHKELKPHRRDTLKRWIEQGAPWQPHWAFIQPKRPPLPKASRPDWVHNPIAGLVLAKPDSLGLEGKAPELLAAAGVGQLVVIAGHLGQPKGVVDAPAAALDPRLDHLGGVDDADALRPPDGPWAEHRALLLQQVAGEGAQPGLGAPQPLEEGDAADVGEVEFGGARDGLLEGKPARDMHEEPAQPQARVLEPPCPPDESVFPGEVLEVVGEPGGEDVPFVGQRVVCHGLSLPNGLGTIRTSG